MKSIRSHTLFALVSIATVAGAQAVFAAREVREEFHQTYPLDNQGKVQLENVNGYVRIGTWDREEIKVEAIKRAEKQEHLDEVKIEVDAKSDRIRIKTKISRLESETEQKQLHQRRLHVDRAAA